MIVKYVKERRPEALGRDPHLTLGKDYVVVGVNFSVAGKPELSIQSDSDGTPGLHRIDFFEVVNPSVPPDYKVHFYENGFSRLQPSEFEENSDFWDRYHDGDEHAEKLFLKVVERIKKFHGLL